MTVGINISCRPFTGVAPGRRENVMELSRRYIFWEIQGMHVNFPTGKSFSVLINEIHEVGPC